ncbi:hypothetical protein Agub_g711, partial [Astrephomene gubernaculifera]
MGKPKKTRNPGVGVDFKRVKHKVGKKLPKARNETDTDFTSRSINLPSQAVREDRSGIAVNYQNLTLKELLNQTSHHNDKARKHSLVGLADLFGRHPEQLRLHAAQVLATLAERVVDGDSAVRAALRSLLHESVLPLLGPDALRPFMPVVMAHVCGAMTHLSLDVRNDALLFLDVMMDHAPRLVVDGFLPPCLAHFCDLFSAAHRGRSIRAQSLAALTKLLTSLTSFLRRAFPEDAAAAGAAAAAVTSEGHDAMEAAGAGAGPGPSSIRQQQLQHAAAASLAARHGSALGADRMRRPLRTAGELLASLEELFRAAAAASRAGRKTRGKSLGGGADGSGGDRNKGKKGRGSVSTSEAPTSSHLLGGAAAAAGGGGSAAGGASGGKAIAAAAAALAAVSAPGAAAAAGMDLSAPSGATAVGVLGAPTTMAAALAAASDARASALRLVSLLMDCWLECAPGQLAVSPELEQAAALAMIVSAANTLIHRLLLPSTPQLTAAAAAGGAGWAADDQAGGAAGSSSVMRAPPPEQVLLLQQLHDVVARRVAATFPATLPPVKPSAAVAEALVRLNLQSAELLGRFLPLAQAQQQQQHHVQQYQPAADEAAAAAAAHGSFTWISALVSYYVGVLEGGVLLPAAPGTLSDAGVQGLPSGASDAVLAAVSAAVRSLPSAEAAQRLMAAVAEFAARQPPRSGARLACIRMQHGLLKAALAGRLFLDDGAVASWLGPLPKLLWEAGGAAPEASAAALGLLLDAARFAAPGSSMCTFLTSSLQPQLAPLFATQLPPKAAKAALAKWAALASGPGRAAPAAAAAADPDGGVSVLLPGVVCRLPEQVASLAVDLLYHTGPLGAPLLKPLAAALSSAALPPSLALRLLDVVLARLRDAPDPALAASWLLTVLFGPQHGHRVLSPDGTDLTAGWGRQRALVDAAARGLA